MEGGSVNSLMPIVGTAAVLGTAIVGGVFFAFSSFIMKALGRLSAPEGIAAMQSINVVVINPSFLGAFMGTALLSVGVIVLALLNHGHPSAMFFVGGAVCYFAGTFLVTMFGNVPLNDRLASESPTDPAAAQLWTHYLDRWTMWNTVRTIAAIGATFLYTVGLIQNGG